MARKQFLINYHTSDVQNMPSQENLRLGEIAVRHANTKPELIIKLDNDEFATFADKQTLSGMIHTVNTQLSGEIDGVSGKISEIEATIENNQTALTENFATKEYANGEVVKAIASAQTFADAAEIDAIAAASAYTDEKIATVNRDIENVAGNVGTVSASVNTLRDDLEREYALKTEVADAKTEAIGTASGYTDEAKIAAIAAASAYTDEKIATVNRNIENVAGNVGTVSASVNTLRDDLEREYAKTTYVDGEAVKAIASAQTFADAAEIDAIAAASAYTDEKIATVNRDIENVAGNISTLSGAIETLEEELTDVINTKVASAYIYKGSCTYAELPKGYGEAETGFVWNVTDANGNFPAGTNYAWTGSEWDALGGSLDLSPYALSADVKTHVDGVNDRIDEVAGDVGELSGVVKTFKADYALKTEVADAKTEAIGTASGYTDEAKNAAIAAASAYTDEKIATVNRNIENVAGNVGTVSASVNTLRDDLEREYAKTTYVDGEAVKAIASAQTFANTAKTEAIAAASAYTDEKIATVNRDIENVAGNVGTVSASVNTLRDDLEREYALKTEVADAKTEAIGTASGYTDEAKIAAIAAASAYTDGQIDLVENRLEVIEAKFPTLDTAIQNITANSGVSASKSGTTVALDFSKMVIDGGEF